MVTGTGREVRGELWAVYRLPVVRVPTNRPLRRRALPDRVFPTAAAKWDAVVGRIVRTHGPCVGVDRERERVAREPIAELLARTREAIGGGRVYFGTFPSEVRPEHVTLADESALRGRVFGAEYLGTTQIVTIDTTHGQLKARLPSSVGVRTGDHVGLKLRAERLALFDAASGRALRSALYEGSSHG